MGHPLPDGVNAIHIIDSMSKAASLPMYAEPTKVKERLNAKGVHTIRTLTAGGTQDFLYQN